jgi:hypothetical protein
MIPSDEPFQQDSLDAQLDELARSTDQSTATSASHAYHALAQFHAEASAREAKSIERVGRRLASFMVASDAPVEHIEFLSDLPAGAKSPPALAIYHAQPVRQRSRLRILVSSAAALLAVCLLLAGFFTVLQRRPPMLSVTHYHWHVIPSPNMSNAVNVLTGITMRTSTDAWAWGFTSGDPVPTGHYPMLPTPQLMPLVEHWDGHLWRIVATPRPPRGGEIEDIVALASDDAWAVGDQLPNVPDLGDPAVLLEHWDGHHWTFVRDAATFLPWSNLAKLAALSPDDIWAVGSALVEGSNGNILHSGLIQHWDGRAWQSISHPEPLFDMHFNAVAALSPDNVWVAGTNGQSTMEVFEHWDGSQWSIVPSPSIQLPPSSSHPSTTIIELAAMSAFSSNDIWVAGTQITDFSGSLSGVIKTSPFFEHWDGHAWSIVASPPLTGMISDILALAPNNVWAVGTIGKEVNGAAQEGRGLIEHWDGQHWSLISNPNPRPFTSLGGIARDPTASGGVWVAGTAGPDLAGNIQLTNTQALIETTT